MGNDEKLSDLGEAEPEKKRGKMTLRYDEIEMGCKGEEVAMGGRASSPHVAIYGV